MGGSRPHAIFAINRQGIHPPQPLPGHEARAVKPAQPAARTYPQEALGILSNSIDGVGAKAIGTGVIHESTLLGPERTGKQQQEYDQPFVHGNTNIHFICIISDITITCVVNFTTNKLKHIKLNRSA